jgi:hypothetical protein
MKRYVGLAVVLAIGCTHAAEVQRPGAEAGLIATVMAPMVAYREGRLYATIWMSRAAVPEDDVVARLEGPGAPSDTLVIASEVCDGVGMETNTTDHDYRPLFNPKCSWALPDARPGTYTIKITAAGKPIGEGAVTLVEVPAAGGGHAVEVDPATRVGRAYHGRRGVELWLPADARFAWRAVSLYNLRDGKVVPHPDLRGQLVRGPRLQGPGDPVFAMWPTAFGPMPIEGTVAAYAGFTFLGAWQVTGIAPLRAGEYGYLPPTTLTPAEQAEVLHAVEAEAGDGAAFFAARLLPRTCAVIASPKAAAVAAKLEDKRGATHGSVGVYHEIGTFSGTSGPVTVAVGSSVAASTSLPPWDTGKTEGYVAQDASYDRLLAALDGLARGQGEDCFAKVANVPWAMPAPSARERRGK